MSHKESNINDKESPATRNNLSGTTLKMKVNPILGAKKEQSFLNLE